MRRTTAERFWAKVDRSGDCWLWTAGVWKSRGGYGKFQAGSSRANARVVYAHRQAWELTNGAIPEGAIVRHRCDNPPCVNPDHLVLGDQTDNLRDMQRRGRGRTGLTSHFRGVSWDRGRQKWQAHAYHNGTTKALGRFDSEEEAAVIVNKYYKEFVL